MSCAACDQFDTKVVITSPGEFRRVATKVATAITTGLLEYNSFESDRELFGQPPFTTLELLTGQLPDVMR